MQNVAFLAVRVVQERQTGRAVRVVFNGRNLRRNPLLLTPEIDGAVLLLVAAAAMPDGDLAMRVASARALLRLDQRFFRRLLGDFALVEHGHEAPRCCVRIKTFQCHNALFSSGTPRRFPLKFPISWRLSRNPGLEPRVKDYPRTRSFFRPPPALRKPFSSRGDALQRGRGGEIYHEKFPCVLRPPSP